MPRTFAEAAVITSRLSLPGSLPSPRVVRPVTLEDVERDLLVPSGDKAASALSEWREQRPETAPVLSTFVHKRIFDVRIEQVVPLLAPELKDWPFPEEGKGKAYYALREVNNMTTGIPLCLAFHWCVEQTGMVPTWPEATEWMNTPAMHPHFLLPAWHLWHSLPAEERPSRARWQRALRWRLGNAYLSFLREMHFLAVMRYRHGIDLRYHIVADAVLCLDFWIGRDLVCLWMTNGFRERKLGPIDKLGDAAGFRVHDVEFPAKPKNGWASVTHVSDDDAAALADRLGQAA